MSGRGNRTLDQYERSGDASPQARWERTLARRDNREPSTRGTSLGGGGGCWCGADFGHDWPGKADGVPHPRDWPGRGDGHGLQDRGQFPLLHRVADGVRAELADPRP